MKRIIRQGLEDLEITSLPSVLTKAESDLVEFTRKLVSIPSLSGEEHEVSEAIAELLISLGYRNVSIDEHGNVMGTYGQGEPKLMFNGHIDHVPPADMIDPYEPYIVDGSKWGHSGPVIRGRGTCDMKANVAAGAFAPAFLGKDHKKLKGSYLFIADVQEEIDSPKGIQSILSKGIRAEYGISGESTGLQVHLGHRGKVQFDIEVQGISSHASNPDNGVNAVYNAIPILKALQEENSRLPVDPIYGPATIAVTKISSLPEGDVAVVPSSCTIRVDRRYIPSESPDSVQEELEALITETAQKHDISAKVRLINIYPLMRIDENHPLVLEGLASIKKVTGKKTSPKTWRFGVNATFMSQAGIPCIGIGPGSEKYAHTSHEHVPIQELIDASKIYAELIQRLCK